MAALAPFRALRPASSAAARVAAVPYDVVNTDEALALAGDPLSFLHVSRAEIDFPEGTSPYGDDVYAQAVANFEREIDFLVRTDHALRSRILVELNARLGGSYLHLGETRKAQAVFNVALESFDRRVRLGADDPFTRYYAAAIHAQRGDAEPALAFLERALSEQRAFTAARARIEPEFDSLRGDQRFQRLLDG